MASIENPTPMKVEHLLQGVKQLSPVELGKFEESITRFGQAPAKR